MGQPISQAKDLSHSADPQTESQCLILASRNLDAMQIDTGHLFAAGGKKRVWAGNRRQECAATKKHKEKNTRLFTPAQLHQKRLGVV